MRFHSWANIGRIVAISASIFLVMVAMLRIAGQRALARVPGFDVVFTVTFGSVIARSDQPSDESAFFGLPIPGRPDNSPAEGSEHAEPAPVDRLP